MIYLSKNELYIIVVHFVFAVMETVKKNLLWIKLESRSKQFWHHSEEKMVNSNSLFCSSGRLNPITYIDLKCQHFPFLTHTLSRNKSFGWELKNLAHCAIGEGLSQESRMHESIPRDLKNRYNWYNYIGTVYHYMEVQGNIECYWISKVHG